MNAIIGVVGKDIVKDNLSLVSVKDFPSIKVLPIHTAAWPTPDIDPHAKHCLVAVYSDAVISVVFKIKSLLILIMILFR